MTAIKALAFDFDGTLIDSNGLKGAAFQALFAEHGPAAQERILAHHLRNGTMTRRDKFVYYSNILGIPPTPRAIRRYERRFASLVFDGVMQAPFVAGARPFLRRAAARFPLYVVSAAPQREVRTVLLKRGLAPLFKGIYGAPVDKPTHLLRVARFANAAPEEIVFFGDALGDYRAARSVGARFWGISFYGPLPAPLRRVGTHTLDFTGLTLSRLSSVYA